MAIIIFLFWPTSTKPWASDIEDKQFLTALSDLHMIH